MVEWQHGLSTELTPPYLNKLDVVRDLLKDRPRHSRLYRFVADAPTTTMQRLKGLMTGGLPTFVDSGRNFASQAIEEDNILSQHSAAGRSATVLGDDTWVSLFPRAFARTFPFPSFDVRDLDTVDRGVNHHIASELSRPEWGILIAHYLGVDHCGHRYSPDHPAMGTKLSEMNRAIRRLVDTLPEDTVLLVFGDHGMTTSGDHGGDSPNELHSALFAYSNTPFHSRRSTPLTTTSPLIKDDIRRGDPTTVEQIDLAATLAFMLGLPVPFGSLGLAIPELAAGGEVTGRAL